MSPGTAQRLRAPTRGRLPVSDMVLKVAGEVGSQFCNVFPSTLTDNVYFVPADRPSNANRSGRRAGVRLLDTSFTTDPPLLNDTMIWMACTGDSTSTLAVVVVTRPITGPTVHFD
eukprot:3671537-Rhodomonas_salina.1